MSCRTVEPELVAYHFGVLSLEERRPIEEHLVGCQHCVAAYVALKREVETAELDERPSAAARMRLRAAVARQIGAEPVVRAWSWWERPFAFGFAAAAVVAAVIAMRAVAASEGTPPRTLALEPEAAAVAPAEQ